MKSTHAEIYKMWMNHVKFNGWEIDEEKSDNENKSNKERRVYIDQITFL